MKFMLYFEIINDAIRLFQTFKVIWIILYFESKNILREISYYNSIIFANHYPCMSLHFYKEQKSIRT